MSGCVCPLCFSAGGLLFFEDKRRAYCRCKHCALVFVPPAMHVDPVREKAEYDLHENGVQDEGYLRFLRRLGNPLLARLPKTAVGLDIGCGPGPALQYWFKAQGYEVAVYDKFYAPQISPLLNSYDFVTATEVVEHLARPGLTLHAMWQLVKPDGFLGLMTKRVTDKAAFAKWHYKNDITHISFFAEQSFQWLAEVWRAELEVVDSDVVIFRKRI